MHEWRDHPKLRGKFHPEYPDDVQVVVHDGGPRLSDHAPELVWVRVTAGAGSTFQGTVLNQPRQLTRVRAGSTVTFVVPEGGLYPLLVTEQYLCERRDWHIHPCRQCGLTELFDAPSDLMRITFPNLPDGAVVEAFTVFCGACGGVQVAEYRAARRDEHLVTADTPDQ